MPQYRFVIVMKVWLPGGWQDPSGVYFLTNDRHYEWSEDVARAERFLTEDKALMRAMTSRKAVMFGKWEFGGMDGLKVEVVIDTIIHGGNTDVSVDSV